MSRSKPRTAGDQASIIFFDAIGVKGEVTTTKDAEADLGVRSEAERYEGTMALSLLYLAPDTVDPAARRRVTMLRSGGASVHIAAFRRLKTPVSVLAGSPVLDLGETTDRDLKGRVWSVLRAFKNVRQFRRSIAPDLVLARNLEMLILAYMSGPFRRKATPLVYECLDIHDIMLRRSAIGVLLRWTERRLLRRCVAILTSSPGFIREYFDRVQRCKLPIILVENRVLNEDSDINIDRRLRAPASEHAVIGWFGVLRCMRSFQLLSEVSSILRDQIRVVVRGTISGDEPERLEFLLSTHSQIEYRGPYDPGDLEQIYSDIDLVWAIDFSQAGGNSDWLLPNRIYEGPLYGCIPIVRAHTESARKLDGLGIGLITDATDPGELSGALALLLEGGRLQIERERVMSVDIREFVAGLEDCRRLVQDLSKLVVR